MKGKIEIHVHDSSTITISGEVDELDSTGKLMIFETLRDALELDEIDQKIIGLTIYAGGIEALGGPTPQTVKIPMEMMMAIEAIRKKKSEGETK